MLKKLKIENFAIFEDAVIDFSEGYSIILGETGAGKSLIVDALMLIIKERASVDLIGPLDKSAIIEGTFYFATIPPSLTPLLGNEPKEVIISREIDKSGKSIIKLNNKETRLSLIKTVMEKIVDIHSQHQNQYLLNSANHIQLLDLYGGDKLIKALADYQTVFQQLTALKKDKIELEKLIGDHHQLENLKQEVAVILEHLISVEEYDQLKEERRHMEQFAYIAEALDEVFNLLDYEDALDSNFGQALKILKRLEEADPVFKDAFISINDSYQLTATALGQLQKYYISNRYDQQRLDAINTQLYAVDHLIKRYAPLPQLHEMVAQMEWQIKLAENGEYELYQLEEKIAALEKQGYQLADNLSKIRQEAATTLALQIKHQATKLYLPDINFHVSFFEKDLQETGIDDVAFMISLNKGVAPRLLSKVVSGGELSRIMLILKIIFAKLYSTKTIILDEIDVGVSGKVATAMAQMIKQFSTQLQVIAISHLPAVIAKADHFYLVKKKTVNNKTTAQVSLLNESEKVEQLATIIAAEGSTGAKILAQELLNENK